MDEWSRVAHRMIFFFRMNDPGTLQKKIGDVGKTTMPSLPLKDFKCTTADLSAEDCFKEGGTICKWERGKCEVKDIDKWSNSWCNYKDTPTCTGTQLTGKYGCSGAKTEKTCTWYKNKASFPNSIYPIHDPCNSNQTFVALTLKDSVVTYKCLESRRS